MSDTRDRRQFSDVRASIGQRTVHAGGVGYSEVRVPDNADEIVANLVRDLNRAMRQMSTYLDQDGKIGVMDAFRRVILTGLDGKLVTGTEGTAGELVEWNSDGDAVDSGVTAGDVVEGPASATDNSVPTYDGTTGKLLQDKAVVFIGDDGRVGVGSPASAKKVEVSVGATSADGLQVSGSAYPTIRALSSTSSGGQLLLDSSTETWSLYVEGSDLRIWDGTDRVVIETGGNVGLGVTNPSEVLHVAGNILATGTITGSNVPSIPSGAIMLFRGTSVPSGWTLDTTDNNKYIRIRSTAVAGTGGSGVTISPASFLNNHAAHSHGSAALSITGSTASHTLTTSQIPGHTHDVDTKHNAANAQSGVGQAVVSTIAAGGSITTTWTSTSAGGGTGHTHGAGTLDVSGSTDNNSAQSHSGSTWTPAYREWFAASKD